MGTCVGLRNIRYFVSFLGFTSIHALFSATICSLFIVFKTSKVEPGKLSKAMQILHMVNIGFTIYSLFVFFFLLGFALAMNAKVMANITTNESLRLKWNAKHLANNSVQPMKRCGMIKFIYFGKLPPSRLARYFELKEEVVK